MKLIFISLTFLVLFKIDAKSSELLRVYNDRDSYVYTAVMDSNESGQAKQLRIYDPEFKRWDKYVEGQLVKGITIRKEFGKKVLMIRSSNFNNFSGGNFDLLYLYNGITGAKRKISMNIGYDGINWRIYYQGQIVRTLRVKMRKFAGNIIGISKVIVGY